MYLPASLLPNQVTLVRRRFVVKIIKSISVALGLVIPFLAYGQSMSFRCKFSDGQVVEFDKGTPRASRSSDLSELIFDQIDSKSNTARLIGNIGAETVRAIHGPNFVHLVEITATGNMNITTIFIPQAIQRTGIAQVVHSRHVNTPTGPLPSQYVGLCTWFDVDHVYFP